jgi:hypothetical protein
MSFPNASMIYRVGRAADRGRDREPQERLAMVLNAVAMGALIYLANSVTRQWLLGERHSGRSW